jgi:dual oxidase
LAEREDPFLCSDVRDKLFSPIEFSHRDLDALNIMRGRDNGLADYNTARAAYKLPRQNDWKEINPALFEAKPEVLQFLISAYHNRSDNVNTSVEC